MTSFLCSKFVNFAGDVRNFMTTEAVLYSLTEIETETEMDIFSLSETETETAMFCKTETK